MDDHSIFMQMVWANFVWASATFVVISIPMFFVARWKLKKMKAQQVKLVEDGKKNRPKVIVFGPPKDDSGHCPLCGQGWPLEGPLYRENEERPESHK